MPGLKKAATDKDVSVQDLSKWAKRHISEVKEAFFEADILLDKIKKKRNVSFEKTRTVDIDDLTLLSVVTFQDETRT